MAQLARALAAAAYAARSLEPRWAELVARGFAQRNLYPRDREPGLAFMALKASPAEAAETRAFIRAALAIAAKPRPALPQKPAGLPGFDLRRGSPGGPGRGGWSPAPIRPGGRGRRG
jgi:hypothetical protein